MCSLGVVISSSLLFLQVFTCTISADTADCSTNFFTLEQSLLQSTDNRFRLLTAFFPAREAHPVLIKVGYSFEGVQNETQTWYWSESEFYLIQPLEVFQFTSLFFSNMPYRRGQVDIQLAANCSSAPEEYMQLLTARVSHFVQWTSNRY